MNCLLHVCHVWYWSVCKITLAIFQTLTSPFNRNVRILTWPRKHISTWLTKPRSHELDLELVGPCGHDDLHLVLFILLTFFFMMSWWVTGGPKCAIYLFFCKNKNAIFWSTCNLTAYLDNMKSFQCTNKKILMQFGWKYFICNN